MCGKRAGDACDACDAIASCGVAVRVTRETHLPIEVMRRVAADASGVIRKILTLQFFAVFNLRAGAGKFEISKAPPPPGCLS